LNGLIIGKSGCGKTKLLLNLLQPGWLDYSNLSVFGKSLFQPEYKSLKKGFEEQLPKANIMHVFENRDEIQREQISPSVLIDAIAQESAKNKNTRSREPIECNFYESADDIPDSKKISPDHKNIIYTISCYKSRTSAIHITFVEGIATAIVCNLVKTISNFHAKQFEKMQTFFVSFLKTRKTFTTYSTTMCLKK